MPQRHQVVLLPWGYRIVLYQTALLVRVARILASTRPVQPDSMKCHRRVAMAPGAPGRRQTRGFRYFSNDVFDEASRRTTAVYEKYKHTVYNEYLQSVFMNKQMKAVTCGLNLGLTFSSSVKATAYRHLLVLELNQLLSAMTSNPVPPFSR